ncbi:MAG: DMT family transporter [Desulfofustis sp.]|jgi:drug/metabolite transporter (DMT)-like permease
MPYLLLVLTTLFWSGNFVLSRGMHADIPPLALSFWRWALALAIMLAFSWRTFLGQRGIVYRERRFIIIQGLLGVTGFNSLIYLAVQSTTAVNAVLINSCVPILIALCSLFINKEPLRLRQWAGILVSLSGVALIIVGGKLGSLVELDFNQGDLLVLCAGLFWALYSVNLKRFPEELHPFSYLLGIMIAGVIGILPFYFLELAMGYGLTANLPTLTTIVYVAIFPSLLAFIFWNRAVRDIGANRAGVFIHLMPVFSSIMAIMFLGESIELFHLQGIALVFAGIFLATYSGGKRAD